MKVLITGSNGLLGQKLVDLCLLKQIDFLATSSGAKRYSKCPNSAYATLDITDEQNQQHQIHFQLLSTDFVFDGLAGPYSEEDQPNPLSVYARSKVEAEQIVKSLQGLSYSIVRTIIVYGQGENLSRSNLILWAKQALEKGTPLQLVDDQFRAPTWADDLAWACLRICELAQEGIFHICGPEVLAIDQIVARVAAFYNLPMYEVTKLSSESLQQPAQTIRFFSNFKRSKTLF